MTPKELVSELANIEDMPIAREELVAYYLKHLETGFHFQYGNVLFLLERDKRLLHSFSSGRGMDFFKAFRKFKQDVWKVAGSQAIYTEILNPQLQHVVTRVGWKEVSEGTCCGRPYKIFKLEESWAL